MPGPLGHLPARPAQDGVDRALVQALEGAVAGEGEGFVADVLLEVVVAELGGHGARLGIAGRVRDDVARTEDARLEINLLDWLAFAEVHSQPDLTRRPSHRCPAGDDSVKQGAEHPLGLRLAGEDRRGGRGRQGGESRAAPQAGAARLAARRDPGTDCGLRLLP